MIKFIETKDGYEFTENNGSVAVGAYDQDGFHLIHKNDILSFNNAMQAFSHLRTIYEPSVPSPKTMEMFLTPSRPIDNMSKFKGKDHANLCY